MIILPPEEKKPSLILKWTFRILFAIVVMFGLSLFMLSILSGTSDAHRHGLEQAMSDMFRSRVKIGSLTTFNILPQFLVEMENVEAQTVESDIRYSIEKARVAFSFADIFFERKTIEDFQLTNLKLGAGLVGPQDVVIEQAGIIPGDTKTPPRVVAQGTYGGVKFTASIEIDRVRAPGRPSYKIGKSNPAVFTMGEFRLTGKFGPNDDGFSSLQDAVLEANGRMIGTGSIVLRNQDGHTSFIVDFISGSSKGQFTYTGVTRQRSWSFETLNVSELTQPDPAWAIFDRAWATVMPSVSAKDQASEPVTVTIKQLTGDIQGHDLVGSFRSAPDKFFGWWAGTLSLPAAEDHPSLSGAVSCGLTAFTPKGNSWTSVILATVLQPSVIHGKMTVDAAKGLISLTDVRVTPYKTEPAATGTFFTQAERDALGLVPGHACLDLIGQSAP